MPKSSGLTEYGKKRNFSKTAEPEGEVAPSAEGHLYVIQKHDATRLHYDLRLELNGTLKSWAVPKGPSLDPAEKRLAVHVEDHPVEYGSFEGIIPKGEYGGGTVMLWDRGWWEPIGDADQSYEKGAIKFRLHGKKLRGAWMLVQMKGPRSEEGKNWLLIKETDDEASKEKDITKEAMSVKTGRQMEEIASAQDRIWKDAEETIGTLQPSALKGARKSEQPEFIKPQLATPATEAPSGDDWIHEVKFDGYRILAVLHSGKVKLLSRNGLDWTQRFKSVAQALPALPCKQAILDGEIVVLNKDGVSDFQALQNYAQMGEKHPIYYYLFDLPYCDGYDLTRSSLLDRKHFLLNLVKASDIPVLRYSEHIQGQGNLVFDNACKLRLEGIISKRANSVYETKRSKAWLKIKCGQRQEFVIIGYSAPSGSRSYFGALLLGYYNDKKELVYCGRVGTGFTEKSLKLIHGLLQPREIKSHAQLLNAPRGAEARGVQWVKPELVAEVVFAEWTADQQLRHPSFKGLREDKKPMDIGREDIVARQSSPPASTPPPKNAEETYVAGVRLSNPQKVLYPEQGVTKLQLAQYYESVAEYMLPYITGRPISIVRCPQGVSEKCFYQRHVTDSLPDTVRGVDIETDEGVKPYIIIDNLQGLISLVQLGVLEIHPWGCREGDIEHPDWIVFDLDPAPDVAWERVIEASLLLRERLKEMRLPGFVKTTGGKGIHVVAPLKPELEWEQAKAMTKEIADRIVSERPKEYIATMSKAKRTSKIFIDYLRNGRSATSVAAYSTRARTGAPVSTPLTWEELESGVKPDQFNTQTLPERIASLTKDPWAGFFKKAKTKRTK